MDLIMHNVNSNYFKSTTCRFYFRINQNKVRLLKRNPMAKRECRGGEGEFQQAARPRDDTTVYRDSAFFWARLLNDAKVGLYYDFCCGKSHSYITSTHVETTGHKSQGGLDTKTY
jgi:hypothetical protein